MESKRNRDFKAKWRKRTRQAISLELKLDIIKRAEQGERAVRIAEKFGLPSSSVRSILSNINKIKQTSKIATSKGEKCGTSKVNPIHTTQEVTTVDETKNAFVCSFRHLVKRNCYKAKQIFHVAETVLFWKEMPSKRVSDTQEYFQGFRERATLLLGGNASGDFKLKPLLVYYLENPRALKGYPKDKLPVIWKTNKRTQLTQLIFCDWFTGYFCPAVKEYCRKNNLDNKALLILNDHPCHPATLDDLSNNVKVIYLPQGIHDLIWSPDLSALRTFKTHYLHRALSQATAAIEAHKADSLVEFWDIYNIKEAIDNIAGAWEDVPPSTMNLLWKNLFPDCVRRSYESDSSIDGVLRNIIELAKDLGMVDIDNIMELLEIKNEEMSNEEALQLEKLKAREEFMTEDYEEILLIKSLSPPLLREAMSHIEAAMAIYKEHDPDSERSSSVCRNIEKSVSTYRQLERTKKNGQQTFSDFYRSINSASELLMSPEMQQSVSSTELQPAPYTLDVTFIKEEPSTS